MWEIVLLKKSGDSYIVMTQNGDVHCISEETFKTYEKANRVSYNKENFKL